jgi:hypothetical protein
MELLRTQSVAVLTEAQMQWDWIEAVLDEDELENDIAIEAEALVFDEWLGRGTPSKRALLRDEFNFTAVRKQVQAAARERAAAREKTADHHADAADDDDGPDRDAAADAEVDVVMEGQERS